MGFGWNIILYLFFAGVGSGSFLIAAFSCIKDAMVQNDNTQRLVAAVQPGFLIAPCTIALGGLFLLNDLGTPLRVWTVLTNPILSLSSFGAFCLGLFFLASAIYGFLGFVLPRLNRVCQWIFVSLGTVLAGIVMVYSGLLLSDISSIAFWNSPLLVLLFCCSSLSTGMASIIVIDILKPSAVSNRTESARCLWRPAGIITLIELIVLALFLGVKALEGGEATQSVLLLCTGVYAGYFWVGLIALGLILPLAIHGVPEHLPQSFAFLVSSSVVLLGGLMLRYCIVSASVFNELQLVVM